MKNRDWPDGGGRLVSDAAAKAWAANDADGNGLRVMVHAERLKQQALSRGLNATVTVTVPRSARVHLGPEEWRTVDVTAHANGGIIKFEALAPPIHFNKAPA